MIGLEFIARTFNTEYKTIAEQIGVTPVTIQHWLKGRKPIAESRLTQLSMMFGLPREYFGKELATEEKIKVQLENLKRLAKAEGYDVEVEDMDAGGEPITFTRHVNPYEDEMLRLFKEQYEEMLITQIRDLVRESDEDYRENYNILFRLVRIMKHGNKNELSTLGKVLRFIDEYASPFGNLEGIEKSDKPLLDAIVRDIKD